jgi:hypothetical protein
MSLIDRLIAIGGSPVPIRARLIRKLLTRYPVGSFSARLKAGGLQRPWYAYTLANAAREAKALGHKAITALEFGVATGAGLLLLCDYRDEIERETGIKIHLIGLDAGSGLHYTSDPRDLHYCWPTGSFEMDIPKLKARLAGRAEVVLGDVSQTTRELVIRPDAPIAAIMFDLDYYTSTRDAFAIFDHPNMLPRVWCYFDDVSGTEDHGYSDSIGVRAAIQEFTSGHPTIESHLSQAYAFKYSPPEPWHQQIYIYHRLVHPDYSRCLSDEKHTL